MALCSSIHWGDVTQYTPRGHVPVYTGGGTCSIRHWGTCSIIEWRTCSIIHWGDGLQYTLRGYVLIYTEKGVFPYTLLLLSYHQTAFFHLSTHFLLNFRKSSKVQGCASNRHCNICLVASGPWPHSHVVSPLKYFHLLRWSLLHATPVYI